MRIGPIVFYWKQRYGAWRPVMLDIDQSTKWFEYTQERLRWAKCNLVIIQPWHHIHGLPGIKKHMAVMPSFPEFAILPYIDHVAFSAWEQPFPDPSLISGPLLDRWVQVLSHVPEEQWLRHDGRRCFGLITNFAHTWNRDAITYLQTALQQRYRDDLPCLILTDHNTDKEMDGVELQINLFAHRHHYKITQPTAVVRPGFNHFRDTTGDGGGREGRYVPRKGGGLWRAGLRACLSHPGVEYVFEESWNERAEGSNTEDSNVIAEPGRMAYFPDDEYWGSKPHRYLKMHRREVKRYLRRRR